MECITQIKKEQYMVSSEITQAATAGVAGLLAIAFGIQKFLNLWQSNKAENTVLQFMQQELERMNEQNTTLSNELGRLHSEIIKLNHELRTLTSENQRLHSEVNILTEEVTRLHNLLKINNT